jgi:hypothetical protein
MAVLLRPAALTATALEELVAVNFLVPCLDGWVRPDVQGRGRTVRRRLLPAALGCRMQSAEA